jgi:multidrug resistance efflux pump
MRPGQKATLHADAYPDQVFADTIESLIPIPLNAYAPCSKAHSKTLEGHYKLHSYFSDLV